MAVPICCEYERYNSLTDVHNCSLIVYDDKKYWWLKLGFFCVCGSGSGKND